ncbi:efflux RND transporter periplasmic adaptor subunit [Sphingomonas sp.]|uniref:HlyD family secretion protein n=1 Tax=Sphingomonas sp. TaxID=28214 RepID=UPI003AFFDB68
MTDHSRRLDTHPKDDPADDFATGQVPEADLAAPPSMAPPPPATKSRARFRAFLILGIVILLGAAAWLIHALTRSPSEATDDAYVGGNVVAITAREGGTVLALHADNTQMVKHGQPLIDLDPAIADVQLASAEAELGRAVRAIRSSQSTVTAADAEVTSARADLARAQADYGRRKGAAADGAVSGEELAHAGDVVTTAKAALDLAIAKRGEAASAVAGVTVNDNPAVLAAIARVRAAAITGAYMHIASPVAGVVAQRTVQLGQRVAAGTPLMAVVPLDSLWVDANLRETQLRDLRVGQPATVVADVYGGGIVFHGHVLGLGAGSGNAFSLLPAQNATGNWIKIVQRVPVRIALDPAELRRHPLRIGLSATVTVDTADQSGALVAGSTAPAGGVERSVDAGPEVEGEIRRIIAQNLGSGR